jgi:hypothetical protein
MFTSSGGDCSVAVKALFLSVGVALSRTLKHCDTISVMPVEPAILLCFCKC